MDEHDEREYTGTWGPSAAALSPPDSWGVITLECPMAGCEVAVTCIGPREAAQGTCGTHRVALVEA